MVACLSQKVCDIEVYMAQDMKAVAVAVGATVIVTVAVSTCLHHWRCLLFDQAG